MSSLQLGNYLENYLESISALQLDVKKNLTLMRELDQKVQENTEVIDRDAKDCIIRSSDNKHSQAEIKAYREKVKAKYDDSMQLSDEKINLAIRTYEAVDRYIRKLDQDLRKFENDIEEQKNLDAVSERSGKGKGRGTKKKNHQEAKSGRTPKKSIKISSLSSPTGLIAPDPLPVILSQIDMTDESLTHGLIPEPIDPNEPKYCYCNQISFGEMVKCDNSECKIEWFHFGCVGLSAPPKGKWYCVECSKLRKRNK